MIYIGLIAAGLLLIDGLYSIVFGNLAQFAFHWSDMLYYLIEGAIAYWILFAIGKSISTAFKAEINEFLVGAGKNFALPKPLVRKYGFIMVMLLPMMLFIFVYSLLLAIFLGLWLTFIQLQSDYVYVWLIIASVVGPFLMAFAIANAFYRLLFPKSFTPFGLHVSPKDQPKLWEVVNGVAEEIGERAVDSIVILPDTGMAVFLEGPLFVTLFGKGKKVLMIGLASIYGLSVSEFKAVLAHEYGHFSNKDTNWGVYTATLHKSLIGSVQSLASTGRLGVVLLPGLWLMTLYLKLFDHVTGGFSRMGEVSADSRALTHYGKGAFSSGLTKISYNDYVFSQIIETQLLKLAYQEGKVINSIQNFIPEAHRILAKEGKSAIELELQQNDKESPGDSHPPLRRRLQFAEKFSDSTSPTSDGDVMDIINDNGLFDLLTSLFNARLASIVKRIHANEATKKVAEKK